VLDLVSARAGLSRPEHREFAVIHKIEEQLPLRLYEYEWQILGYGKDPKKYRPFTHVEAVSTDLSRNLSASVKAPRLGVPTTAARSQPGLKTPFPR
jgi:hypothetical protein